MLRVVKVVNQHSAVDRIAVHINIHVHTVPGIWAAASKQQNRYKYMFSFLELPRLRLHRRPPDGSAVAQA